MHTDLVNTMILSADYDAADVSVSLRTALKGASALWDIRMDMKEIEQMQTMRKTIIRKIEWMMLITSRCQDAHGWGDGKRASESPSVLGQWQWGM